MAGSPNRRNGRKPLGGTGTLVRAGYWLHVARRRRIVPCVWGGVGDKGAEFGRKVDAARRVQSSVDLRQVLLHRARRDLWPLREFPTAAADSTQPSRLQILSARVHERTADVSELAHEGSDFFVQIGLIARLS